MKRSLRIAIAMGVGSFTLMLPSASLSGLSDAQKCESLKLKHTGKYAFCQMKAQSKFVKRGDMAKLLSDLAKCDSKIEDKFSNTDSKWGPSCPANPGDVSTMQLAVVQCTSDWGTLLSGGSVPICGNEVIEGNEQCDGANVGMASCSTLIAYTTGVLTCTPNCQYDVSNCAGAAPSLCGNGVVNAGEECDAGDLDGETCSSYTAGSEPFGSLACTPGTCAFDTSGCLPRFEDTGQTVIDHRTGLEWEKKTGVVGTSVYCPGGPTCGDPNHVNNRYSWSDSGEDFDGGAKALFLDVLNDVGGGGNCFANHCDWRLPSTGVPIGYGLHDQDEFWSIRDGSFSPTIAPVFGPTFPSSYLTATTSLTYSTWRWGLHFGGGYHTQGPKVDQFFVRAVRDNLGP